MMQHIYKKNFKNKQKQALQAIPIPRRIRIKVSADNKGAMYFENLSAQYQ